MSVKIMGDVFDLELDTREKFVLLAMADHADHDGTGVYPGNKRLARKTGYSEKSVARAIENLKKYNLIEKQKDAVPQKGLAAEWKIIPDNLTGVDSTGVDLENTGEDSSPATPDNSSPQPSLKDNRNNNRNNSDSLNNNESSKEDLDDDSGEDEITDNPFKDRQKKIVDMLKSLDLDQLDGENLWGIAGRMINNYGARPAIMVIEDLKHSGKLAQERFGDNDNPVRFLMACIKNEHKFSGSGFWDPDLIPDDPKENLHANLCDYDCAYPWMADDMETRAKWFQDRKAEQQHGGVN